MLLSDSTPSEDATGPADAQKGILVIMDIFGFFEQTLQGADILSSRGAEKYRVLIPDWFEGSPADISWCVPSCHARPGRWFLLPKD